MDVWHSPDNKIKKVIKTKGIGGLKPTEYCDCTIFISNPNTNLERFSFSSEHVIIGEADGEFYILLDIVLQFMEVGEIAEVYFNKMKINFTLHLNDCISRGLVYEWDAQFKYNLASEWKEKGVHFFRDGNFKNASHRFSKSLKLLLSIPINVEDIPSTIDGVALNDINSLKVILYNNLSSCFIKVCNFKKTYALCEKVLSYGENTKAFYKMGVASYELKNYEKAFHCFGKVLEEEPANPAVIQQYKLAKDKLEKEDAEYKTIVKNMFR